MNDKTIKLIKDNENRNLSDLELVTEFYNFLQGVVPENISIGNGHKPKMSEKKAYSIIWYLQEHFSILPDNIEQCSVCKSLYDHNSEGIHWATKGKNFCGACDYLVPYNYDRGRK